MQRYPAQLGCVVRAVFDNVVLPHCVLAARDQCWKLGWFLGQCGKCLVAVDVAAGIDTGCSRAAAIGSGTDCSAGIGTGCSRVLAIMILLSILTALVVAVAEANTSTANESGPCPLQSKPLAMVISSCTMAFVPRPPPPATCCNAHRRGDRFDVGVRPCPCSQGRRRLQTLRWFVFLNVSPVFASLTGNTRNPTTLRTAGLYSVSGRCGHHRDS